MVYLFIILIPGVVFGMICALMAKKKDRSEGWAFFFGFLFGIFALIYYLFCEEGSKRCPKCKSRIRRNAQVCKHCGYKNIYYEVKQIGWYNKSNDHFLCVDCLPKAKSINKKDYKPVEEDSLEEDIYTCDECGREFKI